MKKSLETPKNTTQTWPIGDNHDPLGALVQSPKLLVDIGPIVLAGIITVAILLTGFGAWAALAELATAVISSGRVVVDSNVKAIQHRRGGIVREILVGDGDKVRAGQVLVRLDTTEAEAEVEILQQQLDFGQALEARLLAEQSGADQVLFPQDMLSRRGSATIAQILGGQSGLFHARRQNRDGAIAIANQRAVHTRDEIAGFQAEVRARRQEQAVIREELAVKGRLFDKKLTVLSQVLRLRRQDAALEARFGTLAAQIARARKIKGDAEMQALQIRNDFREKVESELRDTRARKYQVSSRLRAATFVLRESVIRAPEDGVVVGRQVHAVGAVLRPGETVLELVPTQDSLVIEARVQPRDVDNLSIGQIADIRLTGLPQRTTPVLNGRVTYLAADVARDPVSGSDYFEVRIEVPEQEVARLGDDHLMPGMPADVAIKTGRRTPLDYLIQPLRDSAFKGWREE